MKVGILLSAAANEREVALHTKERIKKALWAVENFGIDILIISGKEAEAISYVFDPLSTKLVIESNSYSTLSNLLFSKSILDEINKNQPINRVYLFSSYWHAPRLKMDADTLFGEYPFTIIEAPDPREESIVRLEKMYERLKSFSDRVFLWLGYGQHPSQEKLMGLEKRILKLKIYAPGEI